MGSVGDVIAIDWGTSNRRVFLIGSDGAVRDRRVDDRGMLSMTLAAYPEEIEILRRRYGTRDVIAAGMVGATRGWREAPYMPAPAGLADIASGTLLVEPEVRIVPGVAVSGARMDVMRGEETLVLGAVAAGLVPADARICQPGTHCKWIDVAGGHIVGFSTAMTGELFALLKGGGTLAGMLNGAVEPGDAFDEGLDRGAGASDLAAALFEVRARVLLGAQREAAAAAYASGILIGADVGSVPNLAGATIHLIGAGPLATLYGHAIERADGRVVGIDAEAAFVAGATAIWRTIRSAQP